MFKRAYILVLIFIFFVVFSSIGKTMFILFHLGIPEYLNFTDYLDILFHGLPLDLSVAGFLCIIPALILTASIWVSKNIISLSLKIYIALLAFLLSTIAIADIGIYTYWGFHLDASIFLYLKKPQEAFASISSLQILIGLLSIAVYAILIYISFAYSINKLILKLYKPQSQWKAFLGMTILTCSLILPIRGGLSVSTMNVGKAYYSDVVFFNHAAINPYFNFMYSLFKPENFESQYQFFDLKEAQSIFADLHKHTQSESNLQLLKNRQANIIFVILESFSANILAAIGGDTQIAPNLNEFAKEGMLFSNFYASSYRTDRGLVSILSGYPAQPTAAIIKYPRKTESLPSIPKTLIERGYTSSLYYGGDVDFANMRSYFVGCCGIKNIISDINFPIKDKMTKWGVPDHLLINKYIEDFRQKQTDKPFVDIILTLSSHEPFDVPNKQFEEPYLNSIHYTDSCIGIFIGELKKTPFWDNTLVVMVSDHSIQSYPKVMSNDQRFHIPMIWMGGALNKSQDASQEIWLQEQFGSQNDIAASLLSQMGIDYSHFTFSKDMFNSTSHKFAFFSYNNGFTMADSTGSLTFDNNANKVVEQRGNILLENKAKAFFQNMYWDLGNR